MILQFISLVDGGYHEINGKYLKSYDPNYHPPTNLNTYDGGKLEVTDNKDEALDLPIDQLAEIWKSGPVCFCHKLRSDGMQNRPLTAFNISIDPK